MNSEVCFTFAEYDVLKQEILSSHVQWGSVCLVIGFVLASVFWWWRLRGIDKK